MWGLTDTYNNWGVVYSSDGTRGKKYDLKVLMNKAEEMRR